MMDGVGARPGCAQHGAVEGRGTAVALGYVPGLRFPPSPWFSPTSAGRAARALAGARARGQLWIVMAVMGSRYASLQRVATATTSAASSGDDIMPQTTYQ